MKEKLSILVPAYNEEASIEKTIKKLWSLYKGHEIIVIDDDSSDDTAKIVKKHRFVKLVQHTENKGYGASLKTGIDASKNDLICIIDSDGTYEPDDIKNLLEHVKDYDMVVGIRSSNVPLIRRPAKYLLTKLASYLSNRKIPDLNSGLRIFRKADVKKFFAILPHGFSFTTTITLAYLTNNYSVKYVPIQYNKREGKSTIHPVKDFLNFILLIVKTVTYFKPLKIFFPIGLVIFFGGVLKIIIDLLQLNVTQSSIILILAGIQILFMGILADLIVSMRR